ncbi:MAG TPA: imidazole glycerol phosphate synthase subunit HisH [Candidatus Caccousia avicola]|uniref:Imidazole glycerol phosphate synthase subunit HisH n=1 Tax=Candidatus Caccousia avicola TaxID=2840721 RepID=A0A9D1ARG6_9FIRM|nr:imidazole glycerol phosphate synthase subunit HisH [Candidatus Caccousia avicola]
MIAIIDYGAGNLQSVRKAFDYLGVQTQVTSDPKVLLDAEAAILPGVGAFGDSMQALESVGMVQPIRDFVTSNRPFLGICLGMQLLFEGSEESPGVPGLGILKGTIARIPAEKGLKIPHIGWNSLALRQQGGLFQGLEEEPYVYFVHSYYLHASDPSIVSAQTEYGVVIDAAVCRGSLHAVQFHPEKSGKTGLAMLKNFAAML